METLRLRLMQEPSRVKRLLEAYISRSSNLPDGSYQIRDPSELPPCLRVVIGRALEEGAVWSCWARGSQLWLYTCHMSLERSRERGAPIILLQVYGADAELKGSGAWRFDPLGMWVRCPD